MFPGAFVCPPSPQGVPPFFFSSCTRVPGRRTTTATTYPQLRPSPKLSSRPLKALPKLLSDSRIRKSRLLEISFNRKPSSFPLGVCTLPNSLRGNCRSPLHSPLDNSSFEPRHFPSCLVSAHLFSSNSRERIIS